MRLLYGKNALLAAAAFILIGLHLILRFGLRAAPSAADLPLLLCLAIGGVPMLLGLAGDLKQRRFSTDILAGIAVITAFFLKEYLAGSVIVLMYSGGGALEEYAVSSASSVLKALAKRMPSIAHLKNGDGLTDIRAMEIQIGDWLEVFPHEICPVDGVVVEGHGTMDEAYLTGEPFQIDKAPGTAVISGAVNGDSPLTIKAVRLAADSRYARIVEVLKTSEKNKPRMRRLAERLGAVYTPLALSIASAAWIASGDVRRFLAVLVIATPCPLLLSIPVAILGAISLSAKRGIIIKDPGILERIGECRTAIFDKTGTLTYGEPEFSDAILAPGHGSEETLGLASSIERYSKHPLAVAILKAARDRNLVLHEASEVQSIPGRGLRGTVSGHLVEILGRNNLSAQEQALLPVQSAGLECVVRLDGKYAAVFRFHDTPRVEGASFIRHLGPKHGLKRAFILSGDREAEVRYLASKVGITEVYAEKSPEEKLAIVRTETAKAKTLYVGDGVNDAPALMAATVGVAIGKNSDITSEAAGAVVLDSSLSKVDELMHVGRRLRMIAFQSAVGGMVLSFIGMILAARGHLSPVAGAVAQEGIDLLSILNALRAALPPKKLSDF